MPDEKQFDSEAFYAELRKLPENAFHLGLSLLEGIDTAIENEETENAGRPIDELIPLEEYRKVFEIVFKVYTGGFTKG